MTGRLASRDGDAEALLARFNEASEKALQALGRGDDDALRRALDVREALQHEIERVSHDMAVVRARFSSDGRSAYAAPRVVDRAVERYCAPLEELARVAQQLQSRLEESAAQLRDGIAGEMSALDAASGMAARYATSPESESHRLDVVL